MKVDPWHELIEIKHGSKAYVNEPFVLAAQTTQIYYTPFPLRKRGRKNWWVICKIKFRAVHYVLEEEEELQLPKYFQEDEIVGVHQSFDDLELDAPEILLREDGQYEEIDPTEIVLKDNLPQEWEEEEEVEEVVRRRKEKGKEKEWI